MKSSRRLVTVWMSRSARPGAVMIGIHGVRSAWRKGGGEVPVGELLDRGAAGVRPPLADPVQAVEAVKSATSKRIEPRSRPGWPIPAASQSTNPENTSRLHRVLPCQQSP